MVTVEPGEQVNELRSSWDRVAVVTAQGSTATAALAAAQRAIGQISIKTRPALRPDNEA